MENKTISTKNTIQPTSQIMDGLTFEDILLVPQYSEILPNQVDVKTQLTDKISLNIPFLSAAMDTVTESNTAIKMAQCGGIGIIHKNMSAESQAKEVKKVKKFESGIIQDPITIDPDISLADAIHTMKESNISGMPVVKGQKLVGILTNRDVRFQTDTSKSVRQVMTTQLITASENINMDEATHKLHENRIEKLLIVNNDFELKGMITLKDIEYTTKYPLAVKDSLGRLLVGAAIGVGNDIEERSSLLVNAGVDVITIDTAHGHTKAVFEATKAIKSMYPSVQVIAGNIATKEAAQFLADAGADAVKVGIGPGSICTTRIVAGCGVPQLTAIQNCVQALKNTPVKIIADGGIKFSGDVIKALSFGAHSIMIGNLFAGTDESPGDLVLYQGKRYKAYRGMGSIGAMKKGSSDRYFQQDQSSSKLVPEGIEGRVSYRGPLSESLHQMAWGLRSGMGYCGAKNIVDLQNKAQFVKITQAGLQESHVHDVFITKEAPNYKST